MVLYLFDWMLVLVLVLRVLVSTAIGGGLRFRIVVCWLWVDLVWLLDPVAWLLNYLVVAAYYCECV